MPRTLYVQRTFGETPLSRVIHFSISELNPEIREKDKNLTRSTQLPDGLITTLYTDIEGSTSDLASNLIDEEYQRLISEHNRRFREAIKENQGTEVGTAGDAFLVTFQNSTHALACAIAMQKSLHDFDSVAQKWSPSLFGNDEAGKPHFVRVRMGIYRAQKEVFPSESDGYQNLQVNLGSRIGKDGVGGQILVSEDAYDKAANSDVYEWTPWKYRRLKDFKTQQTIYELRWDGAESRGEPGARYFPSWFKGERNKYIERPEMEEKVFAKFAEMKIALQPVRLVTIYGFGGMGKTRLALSCAVKACHLFDGKVHFVPLETSAKSKDSLAQAIAEVFQLPEGARTPKGVIETLRSSRCLLILDNWESVDCDEAAYFLTDLLAECDEVSLLLTGRERTKDDETEVFVEMEEMNAEESRKLFIAQATRSNPKWLITSDQEPDLLTVLKYTEGHPLNIELVASWARDRNLSQMARTLETKALSQLAALQQGHRRGNRLQTRHNSLVLCIEWSRDRLLEDEGGAEAWEALLRVGLFADRFQAEIAAQACGLPDIQLRLDRLRAANLLRLDLAPKIPKYFMMRSIQEYAAETLRARDDYAVICNSYIEFYKQFVQDHADESLEKVKDNVEALIGEIGNTAGAAFLALQSGDSKNFLELVESLDWPLRKFGANAEARRLLTEAQTIYRAAGNASGQADCLGSLGDIARMQGDNPEARRLLTEAQGIYSAAGNTSGQANCLRSLGDIAYMQDEYPEARRLLAEAQGLYRAAGNASGQADCLQSLGDIARMQDEYPEARQLLTEAQGIYRAAGSASGQADCLKSLGNIAYMQGEYPEARRLLREAQGIYREAGIASGQANCLRSLGMVENGLGFAETARDLLNDAMVIYQDIGNQHDLGATLFDLSLCCPEGFEKEKEWYREEARRVWTEAGLHHNLKYLE